MAKRRGPNAQQTQQTRAVLLGAAVEMLADLGVGQFAVAEVEKRAGIGRALASYHFGRGNGLLLATLDHAMAAQHPPPAGQLAELLDWIEQQLARAARRDPCLVATLHVALAPGGIVGGVAAWRQAYWARETELLQEALRRPLALREVSDELDPATTASMVLRLIHGEQLRVLASGQPPNPDFRSFFERALAPGARKPTRRASTPKPRLDALPGI